MSLAWVCTATKNTFNNKNIGKAEGKEQKAEFSLKEQAKVRFAATVIIETIA